MPLVRSRFEKDVNAKSLYQSPNTRSNCGKQTNLKNIKKIMINNDKLLTEKISKNIKLITSCVGRRTKNRRKKSPSNLFSQTFKECKIKLDPPNKSALESDNHYSNNVRYSSILANSSKGFTDTPIKVSRDIDLDGDKTTTFDTDQNVYVNCQDGASSMTSDDLKYNLTSKTQTLKKLVSIFSNKHNVLLDSVKTQVIDILDPENKISGRQRLKSLNILLNDKTLGSILDKSENSSSEYLSSLSDKTEYENENVSTKLSLDYTKLMISRTTQIKVRSNSGSLMPVCTKNPDLNTSFGCIDGCIDISYETGPRHSNFKPNDGRESFNALSHMFTLRKLLGFDHGIRHSLIKRVNSYEELDEESSSITEGNEDSVDKTLIHIFSQRVLKELHIKNTIRRMS